MQHWDRNSIARKICQILTIRPNDIWRKSLIAAPNCKANNMTYVPGSKQIYFDQNLQKKKTSPEAPPGHFKHTFKKKKRILMISDHLFKRFGLLQQFDLLTDIVLFRLH